MSGCFRYSSIFWSASAVGVDLTAQTNGSRYGARPNLGRLEMLTAPLSKTMSLYGEPTVIRMTRKA